MATPRYYIEKEREGGKLSTADANAFGLPVAAGLEAAAQAYKGAARDFNHIHNTLYENTLRLNAKTNKTKVFDLHAQFLTELNEGLYGKSGILMRQGVDATTSYKDTENFYNNLSTKYLSMTENDDQNTLLSELFLKSRTSYEVQGAKHQAIELQKAEQASSIAVLNGLKQSLYNMWGDPDSMTGLVDQAREVLTSTFGKYGADVVTNELDKFLTGVHKDIIGRMFAEDNVEGVKAYIDLYKGQIDSATMNAVTEKLKTEDKIIWAQDEATKIFNKFGGGKEAEAIKHIRDNYKGKDEDILVSRIKVFYSEHDKEQRAKEAKAIKTGTDYFSIINSLQRKEDKLNYIERQFDSGAMKKREYDLYKGYILGNEFPGDVKEKDANAFTNVIKLMAQSEKPLSEDEIMSAISGRIDNTSLVRQLLSYGEGGTQQLTPQKAKELYSGLTLALNKGVKVNDMPNIMTALLNNRDEKATVADIVQAFLPTATSMIPSFSANELSNVWRDLSKVGSIVKTNSFIAEGTFADNVQRGAEHYNISSLKQKAQFLHYMSEIITIGNTDGFGSFKGTIRVPRGVIPPSAYIDKVTTDKGTKYIWTVPLKGGNKANLVDWLVNEGILVGSKYERLKDYGIPEKDISQDRPFKFK